MSFKFLHPQSWIKPMPGIHCYLHITSSTNTKSLGMLCNFLENWKLSIPSVNKEMSFSIYLIHCHRYALAATIKIPWLSQLEGERAYFGVQFQRCTSILAGKAGEQWQEAESEEERGLNNELWGDPLPQWGPASYKSYNIPRQCHQLRTKCWNRNLGTLHIQTMTTWSSLNHREG